MTLLHARSPRAWLPRALLLALAASSAACGYTLGFANPHEIRSVRIRTVDDRSFRRSIAERLTRQLGRDLTRFTGLVPGTRHADAELLVTVVEAPGRSVVEGDGGAIVEGAIGLRAEAILRAHDGRVLHESVHVDWAEYRAPVGESRALALDESIADLARKILLAIDFEQTATGASPAPRRDAASGATPEGATERR